MTIYSLIDKISVSIGCHFFPKYFRDGLKTVSLKRKSRRNRSRVE